MSANQLSVKAGTYVLSALAGAIALKVLGRWYRNAILVPKFTVINDIPELGKVRPGGRLPGQAVVCGGSIAGILTAAVLSYHYEEVLIVEPEAWLATEEGVQLANERQTRLNEEGLRYLVNKRTRVQQATSFHGFLPILTPVIKRLFPDFNEEIEALGLSDNVDLTDYNHYYTSGCPMPPMPEGKERYLRMVFTRDAYERFLRRCLVKRCDNVRQVVGNVTGFVQSPQSGSLLQAVTYRAADGQEKTEKAAIVIDATGPFQAGLKGLERLGVNLPSSLGVHYTPSAMMTTMMFTIPSSLKEQLPIPGGWRNNHFIYFFVPDTEIEHRGLIIALFENSQLALICGGWGVDAPPSTIDDMRQIAKDFKCIKPTPQFVFDILDIVEYHLDELDPAFTSYKLPRSVYTQYHNIAKNSDFPSNFVAIGDATMRVNPIFGQGCAKAAVGAVTLDGLLRKSTPTENSLFASAFFDTQASRTKAVWDMNKNIDYGFESTKPMEGETRAVGAFGRWFAKRVMLMALKDPELCWTLWNVRWMLAPPTDLMAPGVFLGAFWMWLTGR